MTAPQVVITGDTETGLVTVTEIEQTSVVADTVDTSGTGVYIAGPPGPPGPQGDPGPAGTGVLYHHVQTVASDTWVINHNFGREPVAIRVEDSAGTEWPFPSREDPDVNTTILYFLAAFAGTADLE